MTKFEYLQDNSIRDKLIDIILKVAMQHHDDISKSDEDAACNAVDEILSKFFITNEYDVREIAETIKEATISFNDCVYKWSNCDRLLTSDAGFEYIAEYLLNHMKITK